MAEQTDQEKAEAKAAAAAAKAAEASPAGVQGNLGAAPTKEAPPKAHEGTPAKPAAAANASDVLVSDSGPNYMSTAGLTPTQRARVEGSPVQGNLSALGHEGANEALAASQHRFGGKYNADGSVSKAFQDRVDKTERARTKK